jgi:threonine aldolase
VGVKRKQHSAEFRLLHEAGVVHHAQPAAVSISQATEWGAVYHPDAIAEIAEIAHTNGCKLHVDGARFANAWGAAPPTGRYLQYPITGLIRKSASPGSF